MASGVTIMPGAICRHTPPGLAGDRDTHTSLFDYLAHFLQQYVRAVQVHFQNSLDGSLAGGTPAAFTTMEISPYLFASAIKFLIDSREDRSIFTGPAAKTTISSAAAISGLCVIISV
jgi:hypothetical protein